MAINCPKCNTNNHDTLKFCGECGTQLIPDEESLPSFTKTLKAPIEKLARGTLFADRYEIIEELGTGGMGKIHEQQGNKIKAIENYKKFLDLWKDADPGIAEVEDARERLAGIRE